MITARGSLEALASLGDLARHVDEVINRAVAGCRAQAQREAAEFNMLARAAGPHWL
jgi:hypothetical protein